jgi:transcriptional regulator with XRE-family HTH domain
MKYNGALMAKELLNIRVIDKKTFSLTSMTEMAAKVKISKATYSRLSGEKAPDVDTLYKVSKFLGKPMEYFFTKK